MKNHQIQREPRKENNEWSLRKRNLEEVKPRKKGNALFLFNCVSREDKGYRKC